MPTDERSPTTGPLTLLRSGIVEVQGRMPWSSNGTYLVTVSGEDGLHGVAIYKPGRAERPLWDFPDGLYRREVAAFELSVALGWPFVPATVERDDAPLGPGSLQLFVDADFEEHYFTLVEKSSHHAVLRRMAAFDVLSNNADRKGGHCLLGVDGRIWAIDHGLCFHTQPKLRTVIWDFAGEPLDAGDLEDVSRLTRDGLPPPLLSLLRQDEARALERRVAALARHGRLPEPRSERPYPWPLV